MLIGAMRMNGPGIKRAAAVLSCAALLEMPSLALPDEEAMGKRSPLGLPSLVSEQVLAALDGVWVSESEASVVPGDASGARLIVENVMQISRDAVKGPKTSQDDTQVEPDVAVDPDNPSIIVAVFQQGRFSDGASAAPGFATSHDRGKTWTSDALPRLTHTTGGEFPRASDPVVAIGPDGSIYAQTLAVDFNECRSAVAVQRSDDGGLAWRDPVLLQDDRGCRGSSEEAGPDASRIFNDKNWITVDGYKKSPHYGRIHSVWTRGTSKGKSIVARYSDDLGETWSKLVSVSHGRGGVGAIPMVQPDGDVSVVYMSYNRRLVSHTSTDGGDTFGSPIDIAEAAGRSPRDIRGFGLPSAAIDPLTGTMFVAWQDSRWRSDHLNDIAVSRSVDGGGSWTGPQRVTHGRVADRLDHLTPDVAAHDGFVHLTYTTTRTRGRDAPRFARQRYVFSNGGTTYGRAVALGPRIDLRYAARDGEKEKRKFLGDYVGIAASPQGAHAVWVIASRDGPDPGPLHQTAWSATITPLGPAPHPARAR